MNELNPIEIKTPRPHLACLITLKDGKPVTTSRLVAEVFGKDHKHVLEAIRTLEIPEDFGRSNFRPTEYSWVNNLGKTVKSPMYLITRDGFTLLAMGFTGKKAMQFKLAYIEAFNAMEAELKKRDEVQEKFIETTKEAFLAQGKLNEQLTNMLENVSARLDKMETPKPVVADAEEAHSVSFRDFAKILTRELKSHWSYDDVFQLLLDFDYINEDKSATARARKLNILEDSFCTIRVRGWKKFTKKSTKITPHGQEYLLKLLKLVQEKQTADMIKKELADD